MILYDGREWKTWKDVNGQMWSYNKQTGNVCKFIDGHWEKIDSQLAVAVMNEVFVSSFI